MLHLQTDRSKLKKVSQMMKVLSNPGRLLVVDLLMDKTGMTVGDIAEETHLSQSNASQHLKALEQAGILYSERDGKSIRYAIGHRGIARLMVCVDDCIECEY